MNHTVNYSGFSDMFFDAAEQRRTSMVKRPRTGKIAAENRGARPATLRQDTGRVPLPSHAGTPFSEH